jgi:hypothetical protein
MTALFVRLHTVGFSWNDCSLSNTLFRRDAGAFAAYLVDAETGELHTQLSDGQRQYDIDTAILNVTGELLDLEYGGKLPESVDPIQLGASLGNRYQKLWDLLNRPVMIEYGNRNELDQHIRNLNDLGFDISGISMQTIDADRQLVRVQAKVVDVGHHARRLLRLTGLDVEENQARRLLNDLDSFKATSAQSQSEEEVAHRWMLEIYEPVMQQVPRELRRKLEPAEIFHEVLEHRWFMSEKAGQSIALTDVVGDYIVNVLANKPDEAAIINLDDTSEITSPLKLN